MKNEDLLIKTIENGIRAMHLGTWPNDTKAPYALSKLKEINYGMYEEYLNKFNNATKDYLMKLSNQRYIKTILGIYHRVLETKDFIFYVNLEECDENAAVKMFNRKRELISDNYFAYQEFMNSMAPKKHTWMADMLKEHIAAKKKLEK